MNSHNALLAVWFTPLWLTAACSEGNGRKGAADTTDTQTSASASDGGTATASTTTTDNAASNSATETTTSSSSGGAGTDGNATGTGGGGNESTANAAENSGGGASSTTTSGGGGVFPEAVTAPKIMIVKDSISAGPGCYKKYLLQNLQDNGYSRFEFIGEYSDDCGGGVQHSAVSCTTSEDYTQESFTVPNCFADQTFPGMAQLVATHDPDMILIQLGVNDVWSGSAPIQPILDNYTELVSQARAQNPNVVIVVAQIHRIITDNCSNDASTANAQELVEAVPDWAAAATREESPVFVADLWTNSDATEADDCVHPNDAGAQHMGANWYEALKDLLPKD